ncbi:MAG TPA: DUF4224 domain-containing protein [Oxalicibacterium sp.]|jgi:uncharacterized protein YjcR|nr:DUF4224 domain-containing protein [Oxalicibacterium sp.]
MNVRLSAADLAEIIGCKPNQRCRMAAWLRKNNWKHEIDDNGLPVVAKAYADRKLGITEDKSQAKYADSPNLQAFSA